MEIEEQLSFDVLFSEDQNFEDAEKLLPVLKKCFMKSENEVEILRSVELALCSSIKYFSVNQLEEELFHFACPAAKNILTRKLKLLEETSHEMGALEPCVKTLSTCLKIVNCFQAVFEHLNDIQKISASNAASLLLNSSEVLYNCFIHCKISENVYGKFFSSMTEYLSNFFKKCCNLQDELLNFLKDKLILEGDIDDEVKLFNEVMNCLSKCGILLINLDVKTMAKVWKVYVFLVERYFSCLKDDHNIGETINELCFSIINSIENSIFKNNQDDSKIIKVCCFVLKLIIKFCGFFNGYLKNCQRSLLKLLLILCKYDVFFGEGKKRFDQNLIKQLALGSDPLLSQLIVDKEFIRECGEVSKCAEQSDKFSILCCLILKKLVHANTPTRNLWFNENENILQWVFIASSSVYFVTCSDICLPNLVVEGKQRKFTDLYEYVFITTSMYLMTGYSDEFPLIERTLIKNVLQSNPVRALLAIDIWCLLARFGEPELCLSQILSLNSIFQDFEEETIQVEKTYLTSLLQRLFPLLTETQRRGFLKSGIFFFSSVFWEGDEVTSFGPNEVYDIIRPFASHLCQVVDQELCPSLQSEQMEQREISGGLMSQKFRRNVMKLWSFNCKVLSSHYQSVDFLRICSVMAAYIASEITSDDLFLILCQIKKLLTIGQPTSVQLYFTRILNSLSTARIPEGSYKKKILAAIADIFRQLLLVKQILVKQRTLETFHSFSHVTAHGEVITLSVQNSPNLKSEITNYFKKKPPDQNNFSLGRYICELYQFRFQHNCQNRNHYGDRKLRVKKIKLDPKNLEETFLRWKQDGERLRECFQVLTESQKIEIKNLCDTIVSVDANS